jgi:hypothetical protein
MKKINLFILALVCTFAFACGGSTPAEGTETEGMDSTEVETVLDEAAAATEEAVTEAMDSTEAVVEEVVEEVTE